MSKPSDYRARLELLGDKMIEHYTRLLAVIEGTEIADAQRDLAVTMELQQEYSDTLLEMQEDEEWITT
jgi:hypothetical protein